ncbi:MAG: family 10 glycosylhydrolase [Prevotella sp.]|nr:family 10 glycosylhydrolase [Prevotella sp.]
MRKIQIIALLLALCLYANAQAPKYEVRAVWLTTIGGLDWPHRYSYNGNGTEMQRQELCTILDQYKKAGINTVLLQTRIRGTVIYPSLYEPWDGCLSGKPGISPGYDALQFAIDECHKRGMEIHAWVVTMPVGKWNGKGCAQLRKRFPKLIKKIGDEGYMNPEDAQTARYLADLCEEITRNYDIDGIHLDYIRYPETWRVKVSKHQGRQYITNIVRAIHDKVKQLKPWVKMSCSPIGKYSDLSRYWSHGWNAYDKGCQDAQAWLRDGLMDELFPMMYFKGEQFFPFAIDWAEQSHGKIVAPGLGIYFLSPREGNWALSTITQEMEVLRQYGLGHTYFRGKFLTDDTKGIYGFAKKFCPYPSLIPPMTWANATSPSTPTSLKIQGNSLYWEGSANKGDAPYILYNVYSSNQCPVDINNGKNLIATRLTNTQIHFDKNIKDKYFAVTAMDRYGNESAPLQSHQPEIEQVPNAQLLSCNGYLLDLPEKGSVLDADMVSIETLQGKMIALKPYRGKTANVSDVKEGFYVLKSLNKKGKTHRLGFFMIKRHK